MKDIIQNLLALQQVQLNPQPLAPEEEKKKDLLRAQIPAPVLAHYDRLVARGKKGVAMVKGTACGECHLTIPIGTLAALPHFNDIHICDNCGRYLCVPEGWDLKHEHEGAAKPVKVKTPRKPRKVAAPTELAATV